MDENIWRILKRFAVVLAIIAVIFVFIGLVVFPPLGLFAIFGALFLWLCAAGLLWIFGFIFGQKS